MLRAAKGEGEGEEEAVNKLLTVWALGRVKPVVCCGRLFRDFSYVHASPFLERDVTGY